MAVYYRALVNFFMSKKFGFTKKLVRPKKSYVIFGYFGLFLAMFCCQMLTNISRPFQVENFPNHV